MITKTNYIMTTKDAEALTRAAEIIATISETFFESNGKLYSANDIANIAKIANGLEPVDHSNCNCLVKDMQELKERTTVLD